MLWLANADETSHRAGDVVKNRIVELKDQLDLLSKAAEAINASMTSLLDELKKPKQEETSDLFDSHSPLLSLGCPVLSQVMEHCDSESLHCCEKASHTLEHLLFEDVDRVDGARMPAHIKIH